MSFPKKTINDFELPPRFRPSSPPTNSMTAWPSNLSLLDGIFQLLRRLVRGQEDTTNISEFRRESEGQKAAVEHANQNPGLCAKNNRPIFLRETICQANPFGHEHEPQSNRLCTDCTSSIFLISFCASMATEVLQKVKRED